MENIEITAAPGARTECHITIREFFAFHFVAFGSRRGVDAAERMPGTAKVVAINNTITIGARADGCIEAVVLPHLHRATLADAAGGDEKTLDRTELALVEEGINLLCDVFGRRPSASAIVAIQSSHTIGILTRGRGRTVNGITANAEQQDVATVGCCHDGRIAIAAISGMLHARTSNDGVLRRPCTAVILRQTPVEINATKTDISATEAIVGHGEQAFPLEMGNGGNTIGMGRIGCGDEQLLSLCGQV